MSQTYFEDVAPGHEIGPLVKQPSREEILAFCEVTHLTGRFVSDEAARGDGLERIIVSSWQNLAYMAQLLTDWMGPQGTLATFDVIFRGIVEDGERLECRALVTDTPLRGNQHIVVLDVFMQNERGERPMQGTAEVVLPSRG